MLISECSLQQDKVMAPSAESVISLHVGKIQCQINSIEEAWKESL